MNMNEPEDRDPVSVELPAREAWTAPSMTHLRAGSAENTPGASILDSPLEAIGS